MTLCMAELFVSIFHTFKAEIDDERYLYIKKNPHYELLEQLVERLKQFDAF